MSRQANTLGRNTVGYFGTFPQAAYPEQKQKRVYLRYWGTTTGNTATELFLGNKANARPTPVPSSAMILRWTATAYNTTTESNTAVASGIVGFRCAADGTLTALANAVSTNMPNASTIVVAWDVVSNRPRLQVTGLAGQTIRWMVDVEVTESTQWGADT